MTPCIIPMLSTGNHIMSKFNLLWFDFVSTLVPSYCSTCELLPELILELSNLDEELPVLLRRSQLGKFYPDFQKIERENSGTTR